MWLLKISLILVDSLLKVGPGKTKKILEKSWNFLTKKVYEPWCMYIVYNVYPTVLKSPKQPKGPGWLNELGNWIT
jgi:hypothetical protein